MCGICGYYSLKNNSSVEDLKRMIHTLSHRGPDAEGFFTDETAGLGHTRLSILDTSESANQPMHSQNGRYVIAYNGEVYNFKEIAKKLHISPRTSSDTEIILEAFVRKGADMVHELNGMFAIAIYDKKDKELYLFRDRLGIKPLYYYQEGDYFFFASELKALTENNFISHNLKIRKESITHFLHLGYIPGSNTIYEKIFKFPSGNVLKLNTTGLIFNQYWKLEDKIENNILSDYQFAKEQLTELIRSSVGYRLISDVPYGSFLSGGTDSSLITAVAQELAGNLNTFSIGFNESKYNEAKHAKNIADYLGTTHHEFIVSYKEAIGLIDDMITTFDEPYADSSAIPTMLVSKLARKYVKMTLSGDGGDELFLGYGSYRWAQRLDHPALKALRKPIAYSLSKLGKREKRAANLLRYHNEKKIKSHIFSQEQNLFSEKEMNHLLNPDFQTIVSLEEDYSGLKRRLTAKEGQALFDMNYYLKDDLLVKVDRSSMKYGLETRVPFLDYRIVQFALNLSHKLKSNKGEDKLLLKEILYDFIPKKHFERPKWGFALPLQVWMKKELRYLIEETLDKKTIETHGVVDYEYVHLLKERFFKGEDYLYNRLWSLIILHKFFKRRYNL